MNKGSGMKRKAVKLTETEWATGGAGTNDDWEVEEIQVYLQFVFQIAVGFVH